MLTTTTSSGAQLCSSKRGPWEMKTNPEERPVLLGKPKMNLRAHPQGSGLIHLLSPWRAGLFKQEPPAPAEKPFHLSTCTPFYGPGRCSVHAASRKTHPAAPAATALPGDTGQALLRLGKVHQGPQLAASGAGPNQADYFIPHPLEGSVSRNHGRKEAFIFRSLKLFLAFLP